MDVDRSDAPLRASQPAAQDGGDAPTDETEPWRVEGTPGRRDGSPAPRTAGFHRRPRFWVIVGILLAVNYLLSALVTDQPDRHRVPYTLFREQVEAGNVKEVTSKGDTIEGTFKRDVAFPPGSTSSATDFRTERPSFAEDDGLLQSLEEHRVEVNARPTDSRPPLLIQLLIGFGPTLLLVGVFVLISRRATAGLGNLPGFGGSRAKRYEAAGGRTTFADVAGIDEAEEQLVEVVDFLKSPDKYLDLGATIPRGVLLSGLPGTGKTLLARAVAGEAGVPFFSLSASEFIEMIVGVGARRVRSLFAEAKAVAPAIIFVDELDAIGRARSGSAVVGGHDEREQTLNQILTEMDGFSGAEGVIVLAATNRPEILDPALLRPGRFDRHVAVSPPDRAGRAAILRVHTRGVPLGPDVDLSAVAATTPGMVGADLRNLVNEAALLAARRGRRDVTLGDFTDALEKLLLGAARCIVLTPEDRERTAYHESGHALLGMLQPGADPVRKISIVPRGTALGVTFQSPDNDRYAYSEAHLRARIMGALGGRAAEQVVYGEVTTGAESDLEQVTRLARQMVGRWGMSEEIGPVIVIPSPSEPTFPGLDGAAPETLRLVDAEVRRIVNDCHRAALSTLQRHRAQLDRLAGALLERETLDETEAYRIAGIPRQASGDEDGVPLSATAMSAFSRQKPGRQTAELREKP